MNKKKTNFRYPLWAKTLTVLILSVFIVSGAAIAFFFSSISAITRNHYTEHATELADTLAIYLDVEDIKVVKNKVDEIYQSIPEEKRISNSYWDEPEWEEYLAKFNEVVEMPEYIALFDQLVSFHSKNEAKFTYIAYADLTNNRIVYLVDDSELEERCLPGSFDEFTKEDMSIREHMEEGFYPEITNMPEYGYLVSVGRPIFDESHDVIAFAILDLSMDSIVKEELNNTKTLTIILVSLSIAAVSVGFLLVLFLIIRPIKTLTKAANEFIESDEEELNKFAKINIKTKDEIEDLSTSMKKMENDINRYIVDLLGAEKKVDEMKSLADIDALTGMFNKRSYFEIEERLNEEIKLNKAKFAISMIDLNDLKVINDNFGHENGDQIIVSLANIIKEIFVDSNAYRIGGDEFVIVSENEQYDNIEKLEKDFKKKVMSKSSKVKAAIGVAKFDPSFDNNFEDTFKRADANMYINKKDMKNR